MDRAAVIDAGTLESWQAGFLGELTGPVEAAGAGTYFLKPGYRSREQPTYFVDDLEGVVYQPDVYPVAARIAAAVGAATLVDIGCGRAGKLIEAARSLQTIGIDTGDNLAWCRVHHPARRWLECDLDRPHELPIPAADLEGAVLVCSDVIEHLVQPEHLLRALRTALVHARALVLSTPERDLTRGIADPGPPANACHVREWNLPEFARLLEHHGLPAHRIGLTRSDDQSSVMHTMLVVVQGGGRANARTRSRLRRP
jgi:SAM-dependent methyltransferase